MMLLKDWLNKIQEVALFHAQAHTNAVTQTVARPQLQVALH